MLTIRYWMQLRKLAGWPAASQLQPEEFSLAQMLVVAGIYD